MVFDRISALSPNDLVAQPRLHAIALIGMIFPLSRSLRAAVSSRFISTPTQGANKTLLAGLALSAPPLLPTVKFGCQQIRKMSRDVSGQSDISKMKVEPDGSFKRAASSFRNSVQKGGQFPPEKGTPQSPLFCSDPQTSRCRSLPSLCLIRLP